MNNQLDEIIEGNIKIVGQEFNLKYLTKRLSTGTLPKTMLFTGPQGVGKTTMAKYITLKMANQFNELTENDAASIISGYSSANIKIFNMSVLTSEEEVEKVVAQFTKPLTGHKFIILDECHGMNTRQQDALLNCIDHMDENVFVIFCTTDNIKIRKPLMSRMDLKLNFTKLSKTELRQICTSRLALSNISTTINRNKLISTLCLYANGDARALDKCINELEKMYNAGNVIDNELLTAIVGDTSTYTIFYILHLLEIDIAQGILALDDIVVDETFRTKCARTISSLLGNLEFMNIKEQEIVNSLNTTNKNLYCDFLEEILEDTNFDKAKLIGLFYKYHKETDKIVQTPADNRIKKQLTETISEEKNNALDEMNKLLKPNEVQYKKQDSFEQTEPKAFNFDNMKGIEG